MDIKTQRVSFLRKLIVTFIAIAVSAFPLLHINNQVIPEWIPLPFFITSGSIIALVLLIYFLYWVLLDRKGMTLEKY